ncbi:MAG: hypothetical protein EOP61_03015 [Sphingomonadales bacterium]|nr:MAG: hypothetical protein EOP61_03015 [Sphingomonadales bacterium]
MLLLFLALLAQDRPVLPAPDDDATRTASPAPAEAKGEEVIIQGNRDMSRFRIQPGDAARWAEKPIRPQFSIAGLGKLSVEAEQRSLPGASAPAAMVRLRIPLGRKRDKPK